MSWGWKGVLPNISHKLMSINLQCVDLKINSKIRKKDLLVNIGQKAHRILLSRGHKIKRKSARCGKCSWVQLFISAMCYQAYICSNLHTYYCNPCTVTYRNLILSHIKIFTSMVYIITHTFHNPLFKTLIFFFKSDHKYSYSHY